MIHRLLQHFYNLRHRNTVNILIYHQVVDGYDPMRPNEPTVKIFDWQMKLLSKYFTPISLDQAIEGIKTNTLPNNAVVVTFDDGYLNNLTLAQPVLEKYGVPATFYIATGFSDGSNMWNDRVIRLFANSNQSSIVIDGEVVELGSDEQRRTEAYKRLMQLKYLSFNERADRVDQWYTENSVEDSKPLMMTPEQLKELSIKPGVTIGAHTVNHPILRVQSEQEQRNQIVTSKLVLEQWLDRPVEHFAYPNGKMNSDFDDTAIAIVKQCGFKSAVATDFGKCTKDSNLFALPRFTPWDQTPFKFHLRMSL